MTRTITIPSTTATQAIKSLEEIPPLAEGGFGVVTVVVGALDANGAWIDGQDRSVQIAGSNYDELCSITPPAWAPDKPAGTYRNDDLWHFVDLLTQG